MRVEQEKTLSFVQLHVLLAFLDKKLINKQQMNLILVEAFDEVVA